MKKIKLTFILSLLGLVYSFELIGREKLPVELRKIEHLSGDRKSDSLYRLARFFISFGEISDLEENKRNLLLAIKESHINNRLALSYEVEAMVARRSMKLELAKSYIVQALKIIPPETKQAIRLLVIYAFIETDLENYTSAMESYLLVEKTLQKSRDTALLVVNYSNIADLYIKNGLYEEAIHALNKVSELSLKKNKGDIPSIIYEGKAIAYFYLKKLDSLEYYTHRLVVSKKILYDPILVDRLSYMINMLKMDSNSINQIKGVINNPKDAGNLFTRIHLIRAYISFDQTLEAKAEILELLAERKVKNPGMIRCTLYKLMAEIYTKEKNLIMASKYYEQSVSQAELSAKNMMKTGSVLTFLKYDKVKVQYVQAQKSLNSKGNYLILMGFIMVIIILVILLLYRSFQIRRKLKMLLHRRISNEILFMNSHEVRKYLSNILGIIMVIQISDDKYDTYSEMESALQDSAHNLDKAISVMVEKLKEYEMPSSNKTN